MSTLSFETITLPVADLGPESSLPNIAQMHNGQQQTRTRLDEDDELFIGYGFVKSAYPYRLQDNYTGEQIDTEIPVARLENAHLKAVFLPTYGGRLYSLFDKDKGQELTFSNPVLQPRNLAARNAWLSGGVEWNCGFVGHHPHTCAPLFTAKTQLADGTPVLRFYTFERLRGAVYQMDFFLPEDSRLLLARMRIVNPNAEVVPMYWWSNIAVPEIAGARVVMDTDDTYTNRNNMVSKTGVPISEGIDITYPINNPIAIDFFWKLRPNVRKFVCQLDKTGYGLVETSTARLKGRKLFVWGQGPGGDRWQRFLSGAGCDGRYAEIQCGLAATQYENLPMPPRTAWEWLEAYGALQADPEKVHSAWADARVAVKTALEELIPAASLEQMLQDTHTMATAPATLISTGSGWGALENLRREKNSVEPMCAHLDFGAVGDAEIPWATLLHKGQFPACSPDDVPPSWMLSDAWIAKMEEAVHTLDSENWVAHLQLGIAYVAQGKSDKAQALLERSRQLTPSCWALYGLAHCARIEGKVETAARLMQAAATMRPHDISLAKEAAKMLLDASMHAPLIDFARATPAAVAKHPRVRLCLAFAYLRTGMLPEAEAILHGEKLEVPDIREGENSVTDLWFAIEAAKAAQNGQVFEPDHATPPAHLDFRMNAKK